MGVYEGDSPEAAWAAMVAQVGSGAEGTAADWIIRLAEPTDEELEELGRLTTHNEAGRHFLRVSRHWERLEALGLIRVDRPIHEATGIPYSCEYWSLEVTPTGIDAVEGGEEV